jgi:nucleoside-diphosphate-sugar epimerase
MLTTNSDALDKVYNVAVGERISVNKLFNIIASLVKSDLNPLHREARQGDVRDSLADISSVKKQLGYEPTIHINEGLDLTLKWFRESLIKTF